MAIDIKKAIKSRGWTLERLAAEMQNGKTFKKGINKSTLTLMVNGNPQLNRLKAIADAMGITVAELVKEDNEHYAEIICPHCGRVVKVKAIND